MKEFIFWLFSGFINPILICYFYITETTQHKKVIFYFRHDVWQRKTKPLFADIADKLYQKVSAEEMHGLSMRSDTLGPSKIRLLPKGKGIRLLCNLSAKGNLLFPKSKMAVSNSSVNKILENVLHVMKLERPSFGPISGMHSFKNSLINFKQKFVCYYVILVSILEITDKTCIL